MNLDTTPLTFGRYTGKTPEQVADLDPSYIIWMYDNVKPRACSRSLWTACVDAMDDAEDILREALGD